jgi:hypothetical protein
MSHIIDFLVLEFISFKFKFDISLEKLKGQEFLTKYEVGAKPNPPKNPRRSPKKGEVTPNINVKAETF